MQTQRDHVHAHTFMMGRLSSALTLGDPTSAEIPGKRAQNGLLIGIVLMVLVVAGFAVYGWIVPGGSRAYRQNGAILVEKESGSRYIYRDGVLYPTANLASAMLLQGSSAKVVLISKKSLKDLPRGRTVGIAGAPAEVPAPAELSTGPWLTCPAPSGRLGVNLDPRAQAAPLPDARYTVARGPDGTTYLITRTQKHRIGDPAALLALGAGNARPVGVPATWLGWLPDGPAIAPAKIDGAGTAGPRVGGRPHQVGTLFRLRSGAGEEQFFVLRRDGLAPMSRTEFLLSAAAGRQAPVDLAAADVVHAERSADDSLLTRLPDLTGLRPEDPGGRMLCLQQRPRWPDTFTSTAAFVPRSSSAVDDRGRTSIRVRPGSGLLVTPGPVPSQGTPVLFFVSEQGVAYRLGDTGAAGALKFGGLPAVPLPAALLEALPQGPVLTTSAPSGHVKG